MLRDEISQALTSAMKGKRPQETATLRLILAAIKDRDIASRGTGGSADGIGDDEVRKVLQTMIKQRHDAIRLYEQGNRPELAAKEEAEIGIIRRFLPPQLSEAETDAAVDDAVATLEAAGLKDMGRVMAHLRERYAGRMDFSRASARLKQRLAG